MCLCWIFLQFSAEDLVKEVENSIAEFKNHKQEYDEDRVREQVCIYCPIWEVECYCSIVLAAASNPWTFNTAFYNDMAWMSRTG